MLLFCVSENKTMEVTRYLCLMLTMGLIGPVRSNVDCTSESDVRASYIACFRAQGLEVTLPSIYYPGIGRQSAGYLDVVIKQIPGSVCMKQDNFSRALACMGVANQECGLSSYVPTTTLPQVVDKLCVKDINMNLPCATAKFNDVMQCEAKKAREIGSSSSSVDSALICKVYKAQNDCQRSLYNSCGCATVRQYEQIYLDIFYQQVCPQSLSSFSRVQCDVNNTSIFLDNGVGASGGVTGSTRPHVNCNNQRDVLNAQGACFSTQGLDVPLPSVDIPDFGQQSVNYLDVVLKLIPESVCRKPDNFRRALECIEGISRVCGNSSTSPTNILPRIVDKLCINDPNVNLACAAGKFNESIQCVFKKAHETILSNSSVTNIICSLFKNHNDCQRSLYNSCGCATVKVYETIYLDIFDQAICPDSSISRVHCDVNITTIVPRKPFLGNGVTASGGMSVLALSLLICSTFFCL